MRRALLLAGLLCAGGTLHAQVATPPDTALDAAHVVQQDAFLMLRDSTSAISTAASRLMSGLSPSASLPWLQGRSRGMADACAHVVAPLAHAREVVAKATWTKPHEQKAQAEMLKAIGVFNPQLLQCQKEWKALAADTSQYNLRVTAPHSASVVQSQVVEFERASQRYLQYINVKLPLPVSGLQ
jgi:hypothetical protein